MKRDWNPYKKSVHTLRGRGMLCALLWLLSAVMPATLTGCGRASSLSVSKSDFYFDTVITVTLYGTDDPACIDECFALAAKYEGLFSNTVAGSDVSRINDAAGAPVAVDPETVALIEKGIAYGDLSGGRFDITLGGLSGLWSFSEVSSSLTAEDKEAESSVLPDASAIREAVSHIDYRNIRIDTEANTVCLTDPEAKLDLGGIAKGYIADRMKELLSERGIRSAIINLGGNVLCLGTRPDGSDFRVGIQEPFGETNAILAAVPVRDRTVVTSGVYQRYYRVDGVLYHHLLDVSTGYPYDNGLYSVTILCDESVDGDGLSTTCFALGLDEGMKLVEALDGVEAVFVDSENKLHSSSGVEAP